MATDDAELGQFGLGEVANTKLEDELSQLVQRHYLDARQHKMNA